MYAMLREDHMLGKSSMGSVHVIILSLSSYLMKTYSDSRGCQDLSRNVAADEHA
jgi:hypothetical protein